MPVAATQFRSNSPLGSARVDGSTGIFRGVKIITEGEADGHGVYVDAETCAQVIACAASYGAQGVPMKFNPQTFNHGAGSYAARLVDFRKEGQSVLADAVLLGSYEHRDYLIELAEAMPGTFGLSIDFEMAVEERGGVKLARCTRLDAVTVVDQPAANDGLFRSPEKPIAPAAQKPQPAITAKFSMPLDEDTQAALNAAVAAAMGPLKASLDTLTMQVATISAGMKPVEPAPPTEADSAIEDAAAEDDADIAEEDMVAVTEDDDPTSDSAEMADDSTDPTDNPDPDMTEEDKKKAAMAAKDAGKRVSFSRAELAALMAETAEKAVEGFARKNAGRVPASVVPAEDKAGSAKTEFEQKVSELEKTGVKAAFSVAVRQFPDLYNKHVAAAPKRIFRAK